MSTHYAQLIAALGCLAVFFICLVRYHGGLVFVGLTSNGIAWIQIGPLNYTKLVLILQVLACAAMIARLVHLRGGGENILRYISSRYSLFFWFLIGLWIKIAVDLAFFGFDDFRSEGIRLAVLLVLLPAATFFLASVVTPLLPLLKGTLISAILYSIAYVLPAIPEAVISGNISAAFLGEARFSLYDQDTISSARFLFLGSLGCLALLATKLVRPSLRPLAWSGLGVFLILLVLNGTRQFLAGLTVAALLLFWSMIRSNAARAIGALVAMLFLASAVWEATQDAQLGQRLSAQSLRTEITTARGQLWIEAFEAGRQHPFWGSGFRRYGEIVRSENPESGSVYVGLSGAHGFFQDIWAEHGLSMGVLGMLALAVTLRQCRVALARSAALGWVYFSFITALSVPLLFSGYVFNGLGLYLFPACGYYSWLYSRQGEKIFGRPMPLVAKQNQKSRGTFMPHRRRLR